jgi:glycine cleavage system H protein
MKFSSDHVWIDVSAEHARVGITEHAQDALGDVVFVQFPGVGESFARTGVLAVIESVKAAADVIAPAGIKIVRINTELKDNPGLANTDPLGAGWLVEVQMTNPAELEQLMDAQTYTEFCARQ